MEAFAASAVVQFLWKHKSAVLIAVLLSAIFAGLMWLRHKDDQLKLAKQNVERVLDVNDQNQLYIGSMKKAADLDRAITRKTETSARSLQEQVDAAKKELHNAPGANEPAGAYFDALSDSLRNIKAAGSQSQH